MPSERGGQIFDEIFQRPFFRHFPKKFLHSQKIPHVSPKISDDFFFSHRPFSCLIWYFSVTYIATRGPKSLLLNKITILPMPFLSQGGQTPLPISMGGPWPDLPPTGSTTAHLYMRATLDTH